jgi:hypothetical protein
MPENGQSLKRAAFDAMPQHEDVTSCKPIHDTLRR